MDRLDNIVRETFDYRAEGQPISLPTMRDCLIVRPIPNPSAWTMVMGSVAYCGPQNFFTGWQADLVPATGGDLAGVMKAVLRGGVARWAGTDYTELPVYEVCCSPGYFNSTGTEPGGQISYSIPSDYFLYYPAPARSLSFAALASGVKRSVHDSGAGTFFCHLPSGYTAKHRQNVYGFQFYIRRHSATEFQVAGEAVGHGAHGMPFFVSSIFNVHYSMTHPNVGTLTREESTYGTLDTLFFRIHTTPGIDLRLIAINLQAL